MQSGTCIQRSGDSSDIAVQACSRTKARSRRWEGWKYETLLLQACSRIEHRGPVVRSRRVWILFLHVRRVVLLSIHLATRGNGGSFGGVKVRESKFLFASFCSKTGYSGSIVDDGSVRLPGFVVLFVPGSAVDTSSRTKALSKGVDGAISRSSGA